MILLTAFDKGLGRQSRFRIKQWVHADPKVVEPLSSKFKNDISGSSTATISPALMFLVATTCLPTSSLKAKFAFTENSGKTLLGQDIFGGSIAVLTSFKSPSEIKQNHTFS